jgi:hypothetical protein
VLMFNKMVPPEEASASEVITGVKPNHWNTNIHRVRRTLGDSVRSYQPPGHTVHKSPLLPRVVATILLAAGDAVNVTKSATGQHNFKSWLRELPGFNWILRFLPWTNRALSATHAPSPRSMTRSG